MKVTEIRNHEDHDAAIARITELMGVKPGTPEGDELDALADIVVAWEEKYYPMNSPDASEAPSNLKGAPGV